MTSKIKKVKLKGNESFNFREGWLRKGMRCVEDEAALFTQDDVMERLGVGSKMVKSIRYWLQATTLTEEYRTNQGRGRAQMLTKQFGKVVHKYDPYFDDIFTLFLLHYHIVANDALCMVWNIFFNEFEGIDFTKEDMFNVCREFLVRKMEEGCEFSEKSFADDCDSVLKMYRPAIEREDPEDSLACPLTTLGLLQYSNAKKDTYVKSMPSKDALDKMAVLYVIVSNLSEDKQSVSIDDLLEAPNNIGRVFNLSRAAINNYLDQLRVSGYLTINRTAGLDMVYLKMRKKPREIMEDYYSNV